MSFLFGICYLCRVKAHSPDNAQFSTTQWSAVIEALDSDPDRAQAALQKLCSRYWYPVYAFIRRQGHDAHDTEDLTQGFFHFILARQGLQTADRRKGRFRSFLLGALANFLHNERDRLGALKRGGAHEIISLDEKMAEDLYSPGPGEATPEQYFDRHWAALLVRRAFDELRAEHEGRGKGALFAGLHPFLTGEPDAGDYDQIGRRLGMEAGTVKVALHRARRRFGQLLRREVAHTVSSPDEIELEIRQLLRFMAG